MPTRTLSAADFAVPATDRYFEDYPAGAVYEYGHVSASQGEIIAFAEQFDPQPMHTDPAYAATGPYGGIIASGWHTASLAMRLFVGHYLSRVATLASPGVDELRWAVPLRPDDRLRLRTEIVETRASRSKPDRGIVITAAALLNDDDGCPVAFRGVNLVLRRPA